MDGVCFVPCVTWIKRGVSKERPDKVELTKEDLAQIIEDTRGKLRDVEMSQSATVEDDGDEEGGDHAEDLDESRRPQQASGDVYDMEHYDDDEDEGEQNVLALGQMAEFASNADDPYVTRADADESDSEAEDLQVRRDENLIITGLVDGDASTLVFHVFNEEQGSMYVHHDILLSSFPICVEWLNYDLDQSTPGNLVAVGSMSPVIEVWDVDVINCFEPAYKLGKRGKKKIKLGLGHSDAVLSLAWNRHIGHVLASGSADHSVLLWDLETQKKASQLDCREKVQTVAWHPRELDRLLSADCAGDVRVWECRAGESRRWRLGGEVERAVWDHFSPTGVLASTDDGKLHYIDTRTEKKPLWSIQAHEDACTGLALSPEVPGCLATVSADRTLKVWDVSSEPTAPVAARPLKLGSLHCVAFCPDLPWMLCAGGDNKENSFRLWDVRESAEVRDRFGARPLTRVLPEPESAAPAAASAMETDVAAQQLAEMSGTLIAGVMASCQVTSSPA
ncbi:periodic tryptophan protein 1 homolog [Pollicipes pollicipes]|uniref:periodic tryptophan protein 1 homolog n=1 Tax=Pollicipes pollicipes TaxID=41117 RepID=UPI001884D5A6|nr:periodic tryptophan protein 1 homolog [Pollicipes pollicipes]